jgi:glycerophosphoryl diester phosphodiesterase
MPTYLNKINVKAGNYGLKISGNFVDFVEELKKACDANGRFHLEMKERKEPSQYGHTHTITIDEWKIANPPKPQEGGNPAQRPASQPVAEPSDDLPF